MKRPFNIKSLLKKDIKTICLSLGGFYAIFGAFALLIRKMQTMMISSLARNQITVLQIHLMFCTISG